MNMLHKQLRSNEEEKIDKEKKLEKAKKTVKYFKKQLGRVTSQKGKSKSKKKKRGY